MTQNPHVKAWVDEVAKLTQPDQIYWCDGSAQEKASLEKQALESGELIELDQQKLPGCYLHRTAHNDVARVEDLTIICTPRKEDAGPNNHWEEPGAAYKRIGGIFEGSMKGRTMYVIPYIMGHAGSPFAKIGIELTDSIYVVLNMRIMARMGQVAWDELGDSNDFNRGLHSKADLNRDRRWIAHFPQDNTIWSVGSGYGGNVLLGKKCLALRIASYLARQEGWLAEHMLILGITNHQGETRYVSAAFPSACGKTNLAMLIPPDSLPGYKVETVGDDIAWLRPGPDGRLWAVNPEFGMFGVAPGTSMETNPNAMRAVARNTIYTNMVHTPENTVWWEGMDGPPPARGIDWRGNEWTPASPEPGAHPNSRFTAPLSGLPCISPKFDDPQGVPIDVMLFGGRRAQLAPLIYEAFNWQHGVFVGASMASERTAAQYGKQGEVRRDPMAMLPFCGYNMGDYFSHWLEMGKKIANPPKIFHVNWFRQGRQGNFLWPGFGENLRPLLWALERATGGGKAVETPIGYVPAADGLDLSGLDVSRDAMEDLLSVDPAAWSEELAGISSWMERFGSRLPSAITDEIHALEKRLNLSTAGA